MRTSKVPETKVFSLIASYLKSFAISYFMKHNICSVASPDGWCSFELQTRANWSQAYTTEQLSCVPQCKHIRQIRRRPQFQTNSSFARKLSEVTPPLICYVGDHRLLKCDAWWLLTAAVVVSLQRNLFQEMIYHVLVQKWFQICRSLLSVRSSALTCVPCVL